MVILIYVCQLTTESLSRALMEYIDICLKFVEASILRLWPTLY